VRIEPDAVARSIARLDGVQPDGTGLDEALQLVVDETSRLFTVDGAGLLLLDEDGVLRYMAASDEPGRMLETLQEQIGEGPCIDAYLDDAPVTAADLAADQRWPRVGRLAVEHGVRAVLGVPVDLRVGPVGTLDVYSVAAHQWDQSEVRAIQAYARVIASLLRSAADAHTKGRAADQLQLALDHRVVIEQAKGILMERGRIDAQAAFGLLRNHARSTRRPLAQVARAVVDGERLPGLTS
jgi:GAF domain-containing protein